jgi:hypothetical protein
MFYLYINWPISIALKINRIMNQEFLTFYRQAGVSTFAVNEALLFIQHAL